MAPTYTYSGDPNASTLDELRFKIGDTMSTDWQLSNEELAYLIAGAGTNLDMAAIAACDELIAKYARLASQSVGSISVQYRERLENYQDLIGRLRRGLAPAPYAGGISVGDKETQEADEDYDQPVFKRGMDRREG